MSGDGTVHCTAIHAVLLATQDWTLVGIFFRHCCELTLAQSQGRYIASPLLEDIAFRSFVRVLSTTGDRCRPDHVIVTIRGTKPERERLAAQ